MAPIIAIVVLKLPMSRSSCGRGQKTQSALVLARKNVYSVVLLCSNPITLAMLINFSIIFARLLTLAGDRIMVPTHDEIKLKWEMHAWKAVDPFLVFHTWRNMSLGCSKQIESRVVSRAVLILVPYKSAQSLLSAS